MLLSIEPVKIFDQFKLLIIRQFQDISFGKLFRIVFDGLIDLFMIVYTGGKD